MLRLFGRHRIDDASITGLPKAAFLLAAVVDLASTRSIARAAAAGLLWDAVPSARASANLRQLLSGIRQWEGSNGLKLFEVDEAIHRVPGTLQSDLFTFEHAAAPTTTGALRRLHDLYEGDLLEGIEAESEELEAWIAGQRNRLHSRFIDLSLAGLEAIAGNVDMAVIERLEAAAPTDDRVARAVMIARALTSGAAGARRSFDAFGERLQNEDAGAPEPATHALLAELAGAEPVVRSAAIAESPRLAIPRVLILPPLQLGPASRGTEMLGLALIDEVTHTLSRSRLFSVFAPYSARQIAASPFPKGNPYGVDYLVTTRLLPGVQGSRLTAQLLDVGTQEVLLSDEVRFVPEALGTDHLLLASALASRLADGMRRAELDSYRHTGAATTFVHHLLGSEHLGTMSLQSVRRARSHFQRAIRLAADFAPAQSMLARALCMEWLLLDRQDRELIDMSLAIAEGARERNPMDPIAHREVGHALIYLNRGDEAVETLETAVALGPHHADVLFHYADGLAHEGRFAEARAAMDRALNLNPLPPDLYRWVSATTDYFLGNYASASATLDQLRDQEPAARVIALVEAMNGNLKKARRHRDIFLRIHPDFRLADYQMPQKNLEQRNHYLEGMRRAGFS